MPLHTLPNPECRDNFTTSIIAICPANVKLEAFRTNGYKIGTGGTDTAASQV
jgi:hypothetical protein